MGIPKLPVAGPQSTQSGSERENGGDAARSTGSKPPDETGGEPTASPDTTFEALVEEKIESRTEDLESELAALERQLEDVEDFARISLNERKVKQSETNLSEFSDSMSGFAEKAFNHINDLEDRMNRQSLLLAAILEALDDADVDVDLEEVERLEADSHVLEQSPDERLQHTIQSH